MIVIHFFLWFIEFRRIYIRLLKTKDFLFSVFGQTERYPYMAEHVILVELSSQTLKANWTNKNTFKT